MTHKFYVCLLTAPNGYSTVDIFGEPSPTRQLDVLCNVLTEGTKSEVAGWFNSGSSESRTARELLTSRGAETLARLQRPALNDPDIRAQIVRDLMAGVGLIETIKAARNGSAGVGGERPGLKETKDVVDEVHNALVACGAIASAPVGTVRWTKSDQVRGW